MTVPLRTLVVDDERLARKLLRSLLAEHPEVSVVGEAATIPDAASLAAAHRPDLIFLDVQMPPASGFDLLPRLDPAPAVVFVTAHDEYAVRAFEVSAIDYVLKTPSPERLAAAIRRVVERRAPPSNPLPLAADDMVVLRDGGRLRRVPLAEIAAIRADGHYVRIHLAHEPSMFVRQGISTWATQLPREFLRVDRSLIVNLARVRALDLHSRDVAELTLAEIGPPLLLGRAAAARLRAALPG